MPAFANTFLLPATFRKMLNIISRTIFWSSIVFLAISLWTVSIGQLNGYEFKSHNLAMGFYDLIIFGTPLAILLTLVGTLKKSQHKSTKLIYVSSTLVIAMLTFMFFVNNLFTIGFGIWTSYSIAYEHKIDPNRQVREQEYDAGALGYRGRRVVEVKPFAGVFWKVSAIDTTKLNEAEWKRVDKEADKIFQ